MIKVSTVVTEMISENEVALEAYRDGILNMSSYAKIIKPEIEKRLYKSVKIGTIVTALSRLNRNIFKAQPLRPMVKIEDLNIRSPLCEISHDRTEKIIQRINMLRRNKKMDGLFAVIQGINEISILISQRSKDKILGLLVDQAKGVYDNLAAITVRFIEKNYLEVPNMIYSMVAAIAAKRINLIEIVSTFTEISFVVREKDMKETVDVMRNNF